MANYSNYCLKPDYFSGVSGWTDSSTNDQWLIKNRGTQVSYYPPSGGERGLYYSSLHYNRDEPHGAFMGFIPQNVNISVTNDRGYSTYFQSKGL